MLKISKGFIFVLSICITPLILWAVSQPLAFRFGSVSIVFTSLGQISALLGMSLFATNLILAVRLRFVEDLFEGLDKIYVNHHFIGGTAFILLMLHPLFLAFKYLLISTNSSALFLLPDNNDFPKTLGIIALLGMMFLLTLTFYFSLKYQIWKMSHKFLGIVFAVGFLHMFLIPSDVSNDMFLRTYMLGLGIIAFALYFYWIIYERYIEGSFEYQVKEIKKLNDITEISMRPLGRRINYKEGQFAFFVFKDNVVGDESHPFSFTSSPGDDVIRIAAKNSGDYTGKLPFLTIGNKVKINGPYGQFYKSKEKLKNEIWIAGGIGIAPFLSMAKKISPNKKVDLYWTVGKELEAVYYNELQKTTENNQNFKLFIQISESHGRLSVDRVIQTSGEILGKEVYICGPWAMMRSLRDQFINRGLLDENIHSEEFYL